MTLRELQVGYSSKIVNVRGDGTLRQHFLDMGLIPGAVVHLVKCAPLGDPMELRLHGYELTLRASEAELIDVEACDGAEESVEIDNLSRDRVEHPGLGEGGRYHRHSEGSPLPEGTKLTFALAGNQNCGKTTLFNQLTGSNQHVGNFPGVTVDRKSGKIRQHENTEITDLPGIYSMSPYSSEEIVTRQFILSEKPHGIINIIDSTNIERNLYLTLQLIELDIPMVLALNMMDELRGNGGSVLINEMESLLGIPVVPISAAKNEGIEELVGHALHVAYYRESPGRQDFCSKDGTQGPVHRCLHAIMHFIEDHAEKAGLPIRFAATKVVEGDEDVLNKLKFDDNEAEAIEHIIKQMEDERGLDRAAAIADMRFDFIKKLVSSTVTKPKASKERQRSEKIDSVLTGKYTALPSFFAIMALVFWLTFEVIGAILQDYLDICISSIIDWISASMATAQVSEWLRDLVVNGIGAGIGSILSFLPIIVTLFFFLSLLEDTGYMARVAFITDKLLRKLGLSGRSIVPMLVGFGCTVPGVMASRTLPSERDRKLTIILTPFMSCTAKLPIYVFFTAAFFPKYSGIIIVSIYLIGIFMGILTALILKNSLFKGEPVPFVMELPNYRMPSFINTARLLWEKAKDFLERAFTIIFVASILIWFLQSFDLRLNLNPDPQQSILASLSGIFVPLFAPLGLGDWRIVTAIVTGVIAKESVVSTLSVLFGSSQDGIANLMAPISAVSLLSFCLLYTPCVAAIAAIKRELGWLWTLGIIALQCGIAWIATFIVYLLVRCVM